MSNACCLMLAACCFFRMFLRIILKCLRLVACCLKQALFTIPAVNTASLIAPAQQKDDQLPTLEHLSN